jgi:hypothetical protein
MAYSASVMMLAESIRRACAIADLYPRTRSFMAAISESSSNITLMRAILPCLVPRAHKWLTAVRAGQMVFRSGLVATVGIPPCRAALVRAELTCPVFVLYLDGITAQLTYKSGLQIIFVKPSPAAVSFYCVLRNRERFSDLRIGTALSPHFGNSVFLFGCHSLVLRSEEPILKTRWTSAIRFDEKRAKK